MEVNSHVKVDSPKAFESYVVETVLLFLTDYFVWSIFLLLTILFVRQFMSITYING